MRESSTMTALLKHSAAALLVGVVLVAGSACAQPQTPSTPAEASTPAPATNSVTNAAAKPAQPASRYRTVRPSLDGIGKVYLGREISHVMGWQGAGWLEREEREREERGSLLLEELRLRPGMNVADVGAGTGYYSRRVAPLIAPGGKVYAVDVQPEMLEMLEESAKELESGTIIPVLGEPDDTNLEPGSIDLALMVDVYHELEFPYEVLESIVQALKPDGRVVFVEYRAEDDSVPIKELHKMSEAQIRKEASQHALVWERTADSLPWQHVVIFRRK